MDRYRTIREASSYLRQRDPNTAITEYMLRRLVVSGAVPSMRAGKKYLVSIESLENYFSAPPETVSKPTRERRAYRVV